MTAFELVDAHPGITAFVAAVVAALAPSFTAARSALIRRIDRAWPEGDELTTDEKVEHTVKELHTTLIPDSVIARTVRNRKAEPQ